MDNKGYKTKSMLMFNKIGYMLIIVYFIIVQVTARSDAVIGYVGEENLFYVLLVETLIYVAAIIAVGVSKITYNVRDE